MDRATKKSWRPLGRQPYHSPNDESYFFFAAFFLAAFFLAGFLAAFFFFGAAFFFAAFFFFIATETPPSAAWAPRVSANTDAVI